MFHVSYNNHMYFSLIMVEKVKLPISEETIGQLMFIWANGTLIPYHIWCKYFAFRDSLQK